MARSERHGKTLRASAHPSFSGVLRDAFMATGEKQDAVLRRFEIIGEAASRLAPETQALFPELPFRAMLGMRNIIAHDYGDVDPAQVLQTASHDLEPLIKVLGAYFGGE